MTESALEFGKKKKKTKQNRRMRRENKNLWILRECKILGKGFRIKFTQWWEAKVLIGWNF